uniref:PX domain-containing protein n=1 Tax=Octactis speculum TaxID=3111310 RepID=A0A7S2D5Q1_9STRA
MGDVPPAIPPQVPASVCSRRRPRNPFGENAIDLEVRIASPIVHERGVYGFTYTLYTVYTRTRLGSYPRAEMTVYRRFSDFEWLHARLGLVYHGIILPPLPNKRWVNNVDTDFVRERMEGLARYMNRLARHPRLVAAFELQMMLSATRDGLEAGKTIMPAAGQLGEEGSRALAARAVHTAKHTAASAATAQGAAAAGTRALSSLWGSVKKTVGLGTEPPPMQVHYPDADFARLATARSAHHNRIGEALDSATRVYDAKRKFAHEAWLTGHGLSKVAEVLTGSHKKKAGRGGPTQKISSSPPSPPCRRPRSNSEPILPKRNHGSSSPSHRSSGSASGLRLDSPSSAADAESIASAPPTPNEHGTNDDDKVSGLWNGVDSGDLLRMRMHSDDIMAALVGELGGKMERFSCVRQSHLDRELEFIEFMRFQKGLASSERAMIEDRGTALRELQEASAAVERHRQKLQLTRASAVQGSHKVSVAIDQIRFAEERQNNARIRLDSISSAYEHEVRWCDEERVKDMKAHLLEFVQLQREQAESAVGDLRDLMDALKPTDADLLSSQRRIQTRQLMDHLTPGGTSGRHREPNTAPANSDFNRFKPVAPKSSHGQGCRVEFDLLSDEEPDRFM